MTSRNTRAASCVTHTHTDIQATCGTQHHGTADPHSCLCACTHVCVCVCVGWGQRCITGTALAQTNQMLPTGARACVCVCVTHTRTFVSHASAVNSTHSSARRSSVCVCVCVCVCVRTFVSHASAVSSTHSSASMSRAFFGTQRGCALICCVTVVDSSRASSNRPLLANDLCE